MSTVDETSDLQEAHEPVIKFNKSVETPINLLSLTNGK